MLHPILTLSTPLVLRTRFMLDREVSPTAFSVAKFVSSSFALLIKLPLETVLRRGQVAVLSSPEYLRALDGIAIRPKSRGGVDIPAPEVEAIVPLGGYNGILGTIHTITSEEGSTIVSNKASAKSATKKGRTKVAETLDRRGQGLDGLWRGWKVNWWGLVGLWAAGVVSAGGDGEF
jgi:mitochondrial fusion and transport protein UGO1